MRRRLLASSIIGCLVLGGALFWLSTWDGSIKTRDLRPHDRITLRSGISITVPEAWEGFYSAYVDVPAWIPFKESRLSLGIAENLLVRPVEPNESSPALLALTYFDDRQPPDLESTSVIASAPDSRVRFLGKGSGSVLVETLRPGHAKGYLIAPLRMDEPLSSVRELWELADIEGVELP